MPDPVVPFMGRYLKVLLTVAVLAVFGGVVLRCCNAESRVDRLLRERDALVNSGHLERLERLSEHLAELQRAFGVSDEPGGAGED